MASVPHIVQELEGPPFLDWAMNFPLESVQWKWKQIEHPLLLNPTCLSTHLGLCN